MLLNHNSLASNANYSVANAVDVTFLASPTATDDSTSPEDWLTDIPVIDTATDDILTTERQP